MISEQNLVCSTTHVYHYFFNPEHALIQSVLENGLRPLSDFPDSERWQQIEKEMPSFFERLHELIAAPVIQKPYVNSGIFVSPIDFRLLPGSFLFDKPRVAVPISHLDPDFSCLTYVLNGERIRQPVNEQTVHQTSEIWNVDMVNEWLARDQTKVFFYVPQLVTYQGQIPVNPEEIEGIDLGS